jgi:hypothetical protein
MSSLHLQEVLVQSLEDRPGGMVDRGMFSLFGDPNRLGSKWTRRGIQRLYAQLSTMFNVLIVPAMLASMIGLILFVHSTQPKLVWISVTIAESIGLFFVLWATGSVCLLAIKNRAHIRRWL